ncbi:MAG: hypothetical protein U0531_14150 [Dehalococcoidia bacterium]
MGGAVAIFIAPGASAYQGSTRYGVTTSDSGAWHGGCAFVRSAG